MLLAEPGSAWEGWAEVSCVGEGETPSRAWLGIKSPGPGRGPGLVSGRGRDGFCWAGSGVGSGHRWCGWGWIRAGDLWRGLVLSPSQEKGTWAGLGPGPRRRPGSLKRSRLGQLRHQLSCLTSSGSLPCSRLSRHRVQCVFAFRRPWRLRFGAQAQDFLLSGKHVLTTSWVGPSGPPRCSSSSVAFPLQTRLVGGPRCPAFGPGPNLCARPQLSCRQIGWWQALRARCFSPEQVASGGECWLGRGSWRDENKRGSGAEGEWKTRSG